MEIQQRTIAVSTACLGLFTVTLGSPTVHATEPCGDFGACKTLVEINSSDGDIGFHFLSDADGLLFSRLRDPNHKVVFVASARDSFREQTFTELFVESAEPLCFDPLEDDDPENDEEEYRTLEEFIELWTPGTYRFDARTMDGERYRGSTELGFDFPAAPQNLSYSGGAISWTPGDDLGECADSGRLQGLVHMGMLPQHPQDVGVAAWEIVLEPDVDDGDPIGDEVFRIRLSGDTDMFAVSVPMEYLMSLPDDTPAKLEIGAIGEEDNATFTEIDGICLNEDDGCGDDDEADDADDDDAAGDG